MPKALSLPVHPLWPPVQVVQDRFADQLPKMTSIYVCSFIVAARLWSVETAYNASSQTARCLSAHCSARLWRKPYVEAQKADPYYNKDDGLGLLESS